MSKDWTIDPHYQRRQTERQRILKEKWATLRGSKSPTYDPKALKEKYR